jgi:hypothetical protein
MQGGPRQGRAAPAVTFAGEFATAGRLVGGDRPG